MISKGIYITVTIFPTSEKNRTKVHDKSFSQVTAKRKLIKSSEAMSALFYKFSSC